MTPEAVHYHPAAAVYEQRVVVLDIEFRANPNRFKDNAPRPPKLVSLQEK